MSQNVAFTFLEIALFESFYCFFLSFFSVLLISLPLAFHIQSGSPKKKRVLIMGKAWKLNGTLIYIRYFATIFAPRLMTLFFNLLRQNAFDIQNRLLIG